MEVWARLMRSSHYLRARGTIFAVVPHWRAAWIRWLSVVTSEASAKPCFSLCWTEHPSQSQNLSNFHATQRTGPTDASLPSRLQQISSPHASASLLVLQLYHYSIGFPPVWRTTLEILRIPTGLVTIRCKLACVLPPSSLDPRLASGDRRPLNSRERRIGRAHLPYCPRLRPLTLGKSETVQIATWVVDPDDIESWVLHDLLETCASFEPVSELDFCQIGMTAIVMEMSTPCTRSKCAHRRQ